MTKNGCPREAFSKETRVRNPRDMLGHSDLQAWLSKDDGPCDKLS